MVNEKEIVVSYTVLACNEHVELNVLLKKLLLFKRPADEVHLVLDKGNTTSAVHDTVSLILMMCNEKNIKNFFIWENELNKDFASQKNFAISKCKGDFIFNIDADELVDEWILENLHSVLSGNQSVDVFYVPRINIVNGITEEHVKRWNWNVNEQGWVNFPDWQMRIHRNTPDIKWVNPVHEILIGHKTQAYLPTIDECCIIHVKDIARQEKQNDFYNKIL